MNIKVLLIALIAMVLVQSCTMQRRTVNTAKVRVNINLTMDDMEYVGDITGTATQYYVLGLPVGGRRYYQGKTSTQFLGLPLALGLPRGAANAYYDALSSRQDVDFIIPVNTDRTVHVMFLGRKEILTVRAKAFKIKSK